MTADAATREALAVGRQMREVLDDLYQEAVAADPGLPEAVRLAREEDPDAGRLDVALERERERKAREEAPNA